MSVPVLAYPQFQSEHPFIVETDMCTAGLGAVLAQQQEDGDKSIPLHSHLAHMTELETLALVWAAKIFRLYILGHRSVVFTDHAALYQLPTPLQN